MSFFQTSSWIKMRSSLIVGTHEVKGLYLSLQQVPACELPIFVKKPVLPRIQICLNWRDKFPRRFASNYTCPLVRTVYGTTPCDQIRKSINQRPNRTVPATSPLVCTRKGLVPGTQCCYKSLQPVPSCEQLEETCCRACPLVCAHLKPSTPRVKLRVNYRGCNF